MKIANRDTDESMEFDSSSDQDIEEQLEGHNETPLSEAEEDESDNETSTQKEKIEDRLDSIRDLNISNNHVSDAEQALKSQILILCSAIGGVDTTSDSDEYILGSDALACLKDLKRWIKAVDDATDNWNVASACHDNGLVVNDLAPILIQFSGRPTESNIHTSILLSTLELLVALTRPLILDIEKTSPARYDLYIKLKKGHVVYKDTLLNYKNGKSLKSVVSLALPILAITKDKRTTRDTIILNLCLNFFRNIIRIEPAENTISMKKRSSKMIQAVDNMPAGISKDDISFNSLLHAFKRNKVLTFIQTITAGLGNEFEAGVLAPVCLDCYFYLAYGVDTEKLFCQSSDPIITTKPAAQSSFIEMNEQWHQSSSLGDLVNQEKEIKKRMYSKGMSRHANFGTLLSIRQGDQNSMTLSGQNKLLNSDLLEELDNNKSKTSVATRYAINNNESTKSDFDTKLENNKTKNLSDNSVQIIKKFFFDFVESGFSTLMSILRKYLIGDTDANAFLSFHYFYLLSWVLKFERNERETSITETPFSRFGYIQEALTESTIIFILKTSLPKYKTTREYNLLKVTINCLTEILLTVIDMHKLDSAKIPRLTDTEKDEVEMYNMAGEGLLRTIFSSEQDISILFFIPQDAQKVSMSYANDVIEYTHILLKVLRYMADLKTPIALGKKVRVNKKLYGADHAFSDSENENDEEEVLPESTLKRYLRYDISRYESYERQLLHEKVVNLFVFTFARFNELTEKQLRRCLSYFNRILLKKHEHFLKLVRLDFLLTLHDIKDARLSADTMKDLGKLLSYYMHTFEKLSNQTNSLFFELLATHQEQDSSLRAYLQTGNVDSLRDKELSKKTVDLFFKDDTLAYGHKITILVTMLVYADKTELLDFLIANLKLMKEEREAWQNSDLASEMYNGTESNSASGSDQELKRSNDHQTRDNACYRRLLQTIGFEITVERGYRSVLPANIPVDQIARTINMIEQTISAPLEAHEVDGVLIRESKKYSTKSDASDNHHDDDSDMDEDHMYNPDGPSNEVDDLGSDTGNQELDELDLMEARLGASENRVKGKALKKRKRRTAISDSEADDELPTVRKKKSKKKMSTHGKLAMHEGVTSTKKKSATNEPVAHLSSKYIRDEDNASDGEEERRFFERELRLQQLMRQNEGKRLTVEQYQSIFSDKFDTEIGASITHNFISVDNDDDEDNPQAVVSAPVSNERAADSDMDDDEPSDDDDDSKSSTQPKAPVSSERVAVSDMDDNESSSDDDDASQTVKTLISSQKVEGSDIEDEESSSDSDNDDRSQQSSSQVNGNDSGAYESDNDAVRVTSRSKKGVLNDDDDADDEEKETEILTRRARAGAIEDDEDGE